MDFVRHVLYTFYIHSGTLGSMQYIVYLLVECRVDWENRYPQQFSLYPQLAIPRPTIMVCLPWPHNL